MNGMTAVTPQDRLVWAARDLVRSGRCSSYSDAVEYLAAQMQAWP